MPDTTTSYTHPLVEVNDLHVRFVTREATVHAVNGVSFSARRGEVLCILGHHAGNQLLQMETDT